MLQSILLNVFTDSFTNISFPRFGLFDLLDIVAVWFLLYQAYKFIRNRRAAKLLLGILILALVFLVSVVFEMHALKLIFSNFFQVGIISVIILFQPELRSALEKVGGANALKGIKNMTETKPSIEYEAMIECLCEAVCDLAKEKTGALIVIERDVKLGDIVKTGTVINADISTPLIKNIFFNKSPLHDGAAVISGTRLYAAGCFLPLSVNNDIVKDLGTRHRSAIGMSENSDAAIIVVSEENGTISIALNGELKRNFDYTSLKNQLISLIITQPKRNVATKIFGKENSQKGE